LKHGEAQGEALFNQLGVRDVQAARALPPDVILKATEGWPPKYGIIRDGELVQGYNHELYAQRRFNDTPILIGYTSDEAGEPPPEVTLASVDADLKKTPCKHTHEKILAAYPEPTDDAHVRALVRQVNRDRNNGWSIWTWSRLQTQRGQGAAYVYFFDVHGPDRPYGAPHATEYPHVFGNFPQTPSATDTEASRLMRGYLINFAASGNPNGPGLPPWEKYDPTTQRVMVFDKQSSSRDWPNLAAIEAYTPFLRCIAGIPMNVDAQ
jgi:para-nitrobenzyl esterase